MALTRWSFLELVQRSCTRLGAPRPSTLDAAELAGNELFRDMVDAHNDAIQEMILRLWPEELHSSVTSRSYFGEATTISAAGGSADIIITKGDLTDLDNAVLPQCSFDGYEGAYVLSSITDGGTTWNATMDRTWQGDTANYSGVVGSRGITLPSDFHRVRNNPEIAADHVDLKVLTPTQYENMRQTHDAIDVNTLRPGTPRYCRVVRSNGGTATMYLYCMPDSERDVYVPYVKLITSFDADSDDASTTYFPIPPQHQHIIVDAVLVEVLGANYKEGEQNQAYMMAMNRLSKSMGDITGEPDPAREVTSMTPASYRGGRRMWQDNRLRSLYSVDDWDYS